MSDTTAATIVNSEQQQQQNNNNNNNNKNKKQQNTLPPQPPRKKIKFDNEITSRSNPQNGPWSLETDLITIRTGMYLKEKIIG
eukprot:UN10784